ncbi:MAG: hypothetical protein AAGG07_14610 [Planctomycetota bacterium]
MTVPTNAGSEFTVGSSRGTRPAGFAANRLGLDYARESSAFRGLSQGIIDGHLHIGGAEASKIWVEAADLYGITAAFTQTRLSEADAVREAVGDRARFVAIPDYRADNRAEAMTTGFERDMRVWRDEHGARMVKFWMAPRLRDLTSGSGLDGLADYNSDLRKRQMDLACELGLMLMTHIADPDTWFATKYADASVYGSKRQQYEGLEAAIERTSPMPWLLAHMAGTPEDLEWLAELMDRHPQVVIDTSATKWQVRELSKHEPAALTAFLRRFAGRVIFGTDIVTTDEHLSKSEPPAPGDRRPDFGKQASSKQEAFDLYASRYWAMRALFESTYDDESPIADPDLAMVEPDRHEPDDAPRLRGIGLSSDELRTLYFEAADRTIGAWYRGEHPVQTGA